MKDRKCVRIHTIQAIVQSIDLHKGPSGGMRPFITIGNTAGEFIGPKGIAQNSNSIVVTKAVFSDASSTLSIKQPARILSQGSYVRALAGVIQVKPTPCLVLLPIQFSHTSPFITLVQCPSSSSSHTSSMLIDMYKRYVVVK